MLTIKIDKTSSIDHWFAHSAAEMPMNGPTLT